ncbi:MAG TPA: relaxase/mobilization nuclease domain-containing protein [Longimicrobium sp.]|nr:relaxase/mobilization nuclease domain-containing protein [Longimicrobium sp.]
MAYKPGKGFKGLANYLRDGHLGEERPERVAWMETRNLPTQNPEVAACFMAATARRSVRTEKPLYHFSVSFDRNDLVDRAMMRRVADRTLRDLGLDGYQVVIVAHCDRAHPHMHFMVNRVHPERGTAWSNSWAYGRIERTLRAQEVELGLRVVPGKHARVPAQPGREPERAAVRAVRGDSDFIARVQREAGPVLANAGSWADVERGLAIHGLSVRVKGGGLVVTDGAREVKASQIDRSASRKHLEGRFGPLGDYNARKAVAARVLEERPAPAERTQQSERVGLVQPVLPPSEMVQLPLPVELPSTREQPQDAARAAQPDRPSLRRSERPGVPAPVRPTERRKDAPSGPEPIPSAPPPPEPAPPPEPTRVPEQRRPHTYREAARRYSRAARTLFTDPAAARRALLAAADRDGPERAAAAFAREPRHFGGLRPGTTGQTRAEVADAASEYVRRQGERVRPTLKDAAAWVRQAEDARQSSRELERALDRANRVASEARSLQQRLNDGLAALRTIQQTAAEVYADPTTALDAVNAHRRQFGTAETARVVEQSPERFGALRRVRSKHFLWRMLPPTTTAARGQARLLAGELRHVAGAFDARASAEIVRQGGLRVREAEHAREAARAVREQFRHVNVSNNLQHAAAKLRPLVSSEPAREGWIQRQLAAMVPASALGLVSTTLKMARGIDPDGREKARHRGRSI